MASSTSPAVAAPGDSVDSLRLNTTLPAGLMVGLATAVFVIVLLGTLSWVALRDQFITREDTMATLNVDAATNAVLAGIIDAETGQRGYLITRIEDYLNPFVQARARLRADLERLQVLVEDDPEQLQRARALRELVLVRLDLLQQVVDLQRNEAWDDAVALVTNGRGGQLMQEIRSIGAEMLEHEQSLLNESHLAMEESRVRSSLTVFGGLAVLLVLVCIAGVLAAREVRRRDAESWLRAVQAGLAATLQGEHRTEVVGDLVLQFMAARLRAPAGAFYVVGRGQNLRCVAGLALAPNTPRDFPAGSGLAGEVARADRVMEVGVPAEHLRLESAVVSSTPQRVALVPAAYNRRVNAVLELALQRPLGPTERELLERIRETIGAAVNAAIDRTRLEELLEETQRQAEELQTQQEELRVANEELQGQRDALKSSQVRLEQQQAELEQTNSQLEEQTRSLEEHADRLARGEAELRARTEELQRANDYKSEFLANMSHELRTPLNSSLILAKLLAENKHGNLSEEQVRFAQTIHASGNDLLALINDILDLSKIEAGKMEIRPESVAVERLVESLREGFAEVARGKGLQFDIVTGPDVPARIETDSQRALQILRNLLSNAIKFTASGSVTLKIAAVRGAAGPGLSFAVRDTGIGIAREHQQAIFEAFRQADGSTHRKFGGTGLGLSISRDLASLLGGRVSVESELGAGSTFTLWLPERLPEQLHRPAMPPRRRAGDAGSPPSAQADMAHAPPEPRRSAPSPAPATPPGEAAAQRRRPRDAAGERVLLIVEDDPAFSEILRDLAREQGFEALLAHDAAQALQALHGHAVSAVLLDMHLPDRTGLSLLDEIKRDPQTRHIPVHVVSVADYSHEALSRGAVGYALKPVDREQVADALRRLDSRLSPGVRRVLVVEDDARQRESVRQLLSSEGVEIIAADTAARALELLQQQTFDCMVLDLNLPDLSGYELLEKMGELDGVGYPPVIVYTGRSLNRDEEQRLRRFSRSIIIKDARSPERLLDEVTLFLHQVESELPPERQRMLRAARDREAAFDGRRILVVEDDVRNIFALSKVLEPRGARIDIARNGREALEHLERTRDSDGAPDLVLMDIMMPEMDGLTAMREIRKRSEWKRLPIIALTAKATRDDQEKCLQAGANDYLAKPLDIERLLSLVRVWLPQ